jgi:glycosyltransferase involved in cell wall biosynthesis
MRRTRPRAARVAIACSGLGHVARGNEAWAEDLGRALADRGEPLTLFKGGGWEERPYERVIPCWKRTAAQTERLLSWLPRRGLWRLGLSTPYGVEQITFALGLLRRLRREPCALLHVQDPLIALIVQRARRLGWVRTRTILAHGTEEPLSFLRRITYLQHLAPWHLEEARAAGVWRPTWTAIPNFIDTERFHPGRAEEMRAELGIPPEALVILSVAAIKRGHKRIDYLLDEFAALRRARPEWPLWLVVAGGREAETDELIAQGRARSGDRIRFLVNFPRQRMPLLYRAADVFVLCSLSEMLGIVLLEAAASELPCVVSRHPVVRWVVGPGGEAIEMARPGALAAALEPLLGDPPRRRRLGAQARWRCLEHFSEGPVVDQILDYYRFVLGPNRPGPSAAPPASVAAGEPSL